MKIENSNALNLLAHDMKSVGMIRDLDGALLLIRRSEYPICHKTLCILDELGKARLDGENPMTDAELAAIVRKCAEIAEQGEAKC